MSYLEIDSDHIQLVMFEDEDGYWSALYDLLSQEVNLFGWHYWPDGKDDGDNIVENSVCFLHHAGIGIYGYWRGFVGDEVCDRWNMDEDLQEGDDGHPIDGAETIALERLIEENADFIESRCEFICVFK